MKTAVQEPRTRGRPRSFDRDAALERAMLLFWRRGYEATSISDLTAEMGITPPSLYAAFGDKQRLFHEAVQRYLDQGAGCTDAIFAEETTARGAAERLLRSAAEGLTRSDRPSGCMIVTAATNCCPESSDVQAGLARLRADQANRLRGRIEQGVAAGELPADTDVAGLATFYTTVIQGMTVQARDGAGRDALLAAAAAAMRAWPAD
jgi:AcrR family transcriptional regulator